VQTEIAAYNVFVCVCFVGSIVCTCGTGVTAAGSAVTRALLARCRDGTDAGWSRAAAAEIRRVHRPVAWRLFANMDGERLQ